MKSKGEPPTDEIGHHDTGQPHFLVSLFSPAVIDEILQSSGMKTFSASATADRPEKMMRTESVDPTLNHQ
jgi:hypothetical protein